MKTKYFTFAGFSGSGKTTLAVKIITLLSSRGYRVAALKHDGHSFEMDKEGKDTDRLKKAGAKAIAITSNSKYALIADCDQRKSFHELIDLLPTDIDIVVGEGFKDEEIDKILVYRKGGKEITDIHDLNIIAYATDSNQLFSDKQNVLNINNEEEIADFIIDKYLK